MAKKKIGCIKGRRSKGYFLCFFILDGTGTPRGKGDLFHFATMIARTSKMNTLNKTSLESERFQAAMR